MDNEDLTKRISDQYLIPNFVDGDVLLHTKLNEAWSILRESINANYYDIQKLQNGTTPSGNSLLLDGAALSKLEDETLQDDDAKVPTSKQVKTYVDGTNVDIIDDVNNLTTNMTGLVDSVLSKTNTEEYEPTDPYNPATKKYVDDNNYSHPNHSGDITSNGDGATTISNNAVSNAKFRQSAGFSVVGKTATGTGNVADIIATNNGVLRRSGSGNLEFGTLVTANIGNSQITDALLANMTANTIKGRLTSNGEPQNLTVAQVRTLLGAAHNSSVAYEIQKNGTDGVGIINFKTS